MTNLTVELLSATTADDELSYFAGAESYSTLAVSARLPAGRYVVLGGLLQPLRPEHNTATMRFSNEEADPFADFQPQVAPTALAGKSS